MIRKNNKKKINIWDQMHVNGIMQSLMTYGEKNSILPAKMRVLFDHVIKRWDDKMPPPKEKNETKSPE